MADNEYIFQRGGPRRLGLNPRATVKSTDLYTYRKEGDAVVDMNQGLDTLYGYTDVVESHIIGDSLMPLLRIVPIYQLHGMTISRHFENVQYISLLLKEFGMILFAISYHTGRPVSFQRSKVTVTLHFLRRKTRFNKICHPRQRPRWQVDKEAIGLSSVQQCSSTYSPPS